MKNLKIGGLLGGYYFKAEDTKDEVWLNKLSNLISKEYGNGGVAVGGAFHNGVEPARGVFNFKRIDRFIEFAKKYNLKLRGVSLIYSSWLAPKWLFPTTEHGDELHCGNWTKEELREILKEYITKTVNHYGSYLYALEVVNEAFDKDGKFWNRCYFKIMGEDYIKDAFRFAKEVNPNAILYLNDTFGRGRINRVKATGFFNFVKKYEKF